MDSAADGGLDGLDSGAGHPGDDALPDDYPMSGLTHGSQMGLLLTLAVLAGLAALGKHMGLTNEMCAANAVCTALAVGGGMYMSAPGAKEEHTHIPRRMVRRHLATSPKPGQSVPSPAPMLPDRRRQYSARSGQA